MFVDVIPVSAVLYMINSANCYQNGPQKARKEAKLSEEEGENQQSVQQISSSEIKEILKKWTELQIFVEKTHPDREKANHCIHLLNDNVMSYYRTVLKKKQKQTTLDQF